MRGSGFSAVPMSSTSGTPAVAQDRVDLRLQLADRRVQLALPDVLALPHPHGDAVEQPRRALARASSGVTTSASPVAFGQRPADRPPHHRGVELARRAARRASRSFGCSCARCPPSGGSPRPSSISPCRARWLAGGLPAITPIRRPCSRGSASVVTSARSLSARVDQHVGRGVVVVGVQHQLVALGVAEITSQRFSTQRAPHEALRHRIPGVLQLAPERLGEELGDLVLEALARLVGERQVGRVGADPEGGARDEVGQLRRAPAPRAPSGRGRPARRACASAHAGILRPRCRLAGLSARLAGRPRGIASDPTALR